MTLKVDPVTAAAVALVIGLIAYNATRTEEGEDKLEVESFWCFGACAILRGDHESPSVIVDKDDEPAKTD